MYTYIYTLFYFKYSTIKYLFGGFQILCIIYTNRSRLELLTPACEACKRLSQTLFDNYYSMLKIVLNYLYVNLKGNSFYITLYLYNSETELFTPLSGPFLLDSYVKPLIVFNRIKWLDQAYVVTNFKYYIVIVIKNNNSKIPLSCHTRV